MPADDAGDARFETALGWIRIRWCRDAIVGDQLLGTAAAGSTPASDTASPPPDVLAVMRRITRLVAGDCNDDLRDVRLDMSGLAPFDRQVYDVLRAVGPGSTVTYGELARRAGHPSAARAVGRVLGRNPFPVVVPCHRVVAANGAIGGFSAPGGVTTKLRLLDAERRWQPPDPGQLMLSFM